METLMRHVMSPEYRARLDAAPRIEREDEYAHLTYDGLVSICGRRIDPNYSATNKVPCEECHRR